MVYSDRRFGLDLGRAIHFGDKKAPLKTAGTEEEVYAEITRYRLPNKEARVREKV